MDARALLALVDQFKEAPHRLAVEVAQAQKVASANVAQVAGATEDVVSAILEAP